MDVLLSSDGTNYTADGSFVLTEGTGSALPTQTLGLGGATARYVKFDLNTTYGSTGNIGLSAVPFDGAAASEPGTLALLAAGLIVFGCFRRRAART